MVSGQLITPSIRLVHEIGAGGMGSIWVADHLALQTQVVVKFMHAQLAQDRDGLLRFTREAAAAANVKSPHVVQVLDHGVTNDGTAFIVMELLEGADLGAWIERHGVVPPEQVALVIGQTCKALARAHERGIVHRDIKPQNIFLSQVGEGEVFVKVLDFGIAKASTQQSMDSATKTGALMGTPYYMSPEQTVGAKGIDHRTDLWALGVVAFEALTGRRPFEAETVGGLAVAICHGPIPMPSSVNPSLPPGIDAWFARACAREPGQRFQSAKEMADALQPLVTGAPAGSLGVARTIPLGPSVLASTPQPSVPALRVTTSAPTSEEVAGVPQRSFAPAMLGVGGLLLVVGIGAFTYASLHHPNNHAQSASAEPPVISPPTALSLTPLETAQPVVAASDPSGARPTPSPAAVASKPTSSGATKRAAPTSGPSTTSSAKPTPSTTPSAKPTASAKTDRFSID